MSDQPDEIVIKRVIIDRKNRTVTTIRPGDITQDQRHELPKSRPQDATCPHCGAPGSTETELCAEYLEQVARRQFDRADQ